MISRIRLLGSLAICICAFTALAFARAAYVPPELIRNSGFDNDIAFDYWMGDTSELVTAPYRSPPNAAHLKNSKTYFYQKVLSWTPAGCYDISFYARNALVDGPAGFLATSNRLDIDFNHDALIGNEWMGANPGPGLPLKNLASGISNTDFKFYRFRRCISADEADEHSDLRIRFAGAGYVIDDVSILGPYCQTGANLGFEDGLLPLDGGGNQGFNCWYPSGPNLDVIQVKCDIAPLDEGHCYAEIGTLGTGPATAPNMIERSDVAMQNLSPNPVTYNSCFSYRFVTTEDVFSLIFLGTNDFMNVKIRDQDGVVVEQHTITALDVILPPPPSNFSPWAQKCVQVTVPAGKTLFAKITAQITNDDDYFSTPLALGRQSWGQVDDFSFDPLP